MRLLLTSPTDFVLSEGEYLPQVRFELEGVELASEARVRFVGPVRNTRIRQPMRPVGIEFLNMSPNFEQRVMAYVQRRDRETLRERERRY
jgi:c-di-GMP-binding flagellar brake protein YcgR